MRNYIFLLLLFNLFLGCSKEEVQLYECAGLVPSYDLDIKPIIESNCIDCHARFKDLDYIRRYGDNDKLLGGVQHAEGYKPMPKGQPKLSDSLVQVISCWVQNGMPD